MSKSIPDVGYVIRYSYLWWNEHRKGQEEGLKNRPCSIVLNRKNADGQTVLYVLPITHTPPINPEHGIELPTPTKKRLGLDDEKSWIITTEFNKFTWPGYDIRKTPSNEYSYGVLPEYLIKQINQAVLNHARNKRLREIGRDDTE